MRRTTICCFCLLLLSPAFLAAETPLVPRGPAAQVNGAGADSSDGEAPVPALAPDGNLLVVWGTSRQSGSAILVRRFDATGKPGPAGTVISAGPGRQQPRIIPFAPDRFLTVWSNIVPPPLSGPRRAVGAADTLSARLLDATGAPLGSEVQVDTSGLGAYEPLLAALPGGGAVAVWESNRLAGRLFNAAGQPVGTEIDIAPSCQARTVALSGFPGGGFLPLWLATSDAPGSPCVGIQGRLFGADGKPVTDLLHIPYAPAMAVAPNGSFLALTSTPLGTSPTRATARPAPATPCP